MKTLVVFYSLEGNTRFIGRNIADKLHADILELKPKEEIPVKGLKKFFLGGRQVMTKHQAPLQPFDKNLDEYDRIVIGSPVWAGTYAPAVNTFFHLYPFKNKKVALFCCHAGGPGKIFSKMRKALEGNEILGQVDFKDPVKKNKTEEAEKRISEWIAQTFSGA